MSLFETVLSVPLEDIEVKLRVCPPIPWADFFLNPRRLRGSDFLMRWSQGVWSEKAVQVLDQAAGSTGGHYHETV